MPDPSSVKMTAVPVETRNYSIILPSRPTRPIDDQPTVQLLPQGEYNLTRFVYATTLDDLRTLRTLLDTVIAKEQKDA